ncbi:nesprin-1-like isoform X1 [Petromyzon marinus]|uniref:nesprin-1-like isoform X1 n=1 Tax=Petromyzon marinus TaxID=7757 RepID=UPI003F6F5863
MRGAARARGGGGRGGGEPHPEHIRAGMAARSPRGLSALGVGEMSCVAEEAELEMLYEEEEEEEEYEDLRCFSRYCESPVDQYHRHSLSPVPEESGEEEEEPCGVSAGSASSRSSSCEGLSPGALPRDGSPKRAATAAAAAAVVTAVAQSACEQELLRAAAVKLRTLATPRLPGTRRREEEGEGEEGPEDAEEVEEVQDEKRPLSSWETLEYLVRAQDRPLQDRAGVAWQQRRRSSDDEEYKEDEEEDEDEEEGLARSQPSREDGVASTLGSDEPWRRKRSRRDESEHRAGTSGREREEDTVREATASARHRASNGQQPRQRRRRLRNGSAPEAPAASGEPDDRYEEEEEEEAAATTAWSRAAEGGGGAAQEGGWALRVALTEAERVQSWLMQAHASLGRCGAARWGRTRDVASQLVDCQSLLTEIERKVSVLGALITRSDALLEEVRARAGSRTPILAGAAGGDGNSACLDSTAATEAGEWAAPNDGQPMDTGCGREPDGDDGDDAAGKELASDGPESDVRPAESPGRCCESEQATVQHAAAQHVDAQRLRRRAHAEEISARLRTLKGSLLGLQKVLLDRQTILQEDLVLEEYSERVERLPTGSLLSGGVSLAAAAAPGAAAASATVDHNCNRQPQTLRGLLEELKLLLDEAVSEHEALSARLRQASGTARSEGLGEGHRQPPWGLLEQEQQSKMRVLADLLHCRDISGSVPLASMSPLEEAWGPGRPPPAHRAAAVAPRAAARLGRSAGGGAGDGEVQNGVEHHGEGTVEEEVEEDGDEERGEEEEEEGGERPRDPEWKRFSVLRAASRRLDAVEEALLLPWADGDEEREARLEEEEELCVHLAELDRELRHRSWEDDAASEPGPGDATATAAAATRRGVQLRLGALEAALRASCSALRDGISRVAEHQREVAALQNAVSSERRSFQRKLQHCADHSPTQQLEVLREVARSLDSLRSQAAPLRQRQLEAKPTSPAGTDLARIEHMLETLEEDVHGRRHALTRACAADRRYEQELRALLMLARLADERLLSAPRLLLAAADLEQAEQQCLALQEFFRRLEERRFAVEEWARRASGRRDAAWTRLQARLDEQQESLRAGVADQRWIIQAWQQLEREHEDLSRQLEHAEGSMVARGVVEESEEWLSDRIAALLRLRSHLDEHLPRVSQLLADGKRLHGLLMARLSSADEAARAGRDDGEGPRVTTSGAGGDPAEPTLRISGEGERSPAAPVSDGGAEGRSAPQGELGDGAPRPTALALGLAAGPGLTCHLEGFGQRWADCGGRLGAELRRLQALLAHLARFRRECTELLLWLAESRGRLDYWSNQADTVAHEPSTAQELFHRFMAFVHEANVKVSLKAAVVAGGTRLLQLQQGEATAPRTQLAQLETAWAELTARVPLVQERLHQALVACRPSCQAMAELLDWVDEVERRLASDGDKLSGLVGAAPLRVLLDEYKGLTLDTQARQPLVDSVSQALLQQQQDAAHVQARRREKLQLAESVGVLDRRWQALLGRLAATAEKLETRLEAWTEWEALARSVRDWLEAQAVGRLAALRQCRGGGATAALALAACSELQDKLKAQVEEVDKLEVCGGSVVPADGTSPGGLVSETLRELRASCSHVQQELSRVVEQQRELVEAWGSRDAAHEAVNRALWEAWHGLSRASVLTGSAQAAQRQTSILQRLQGEGERRAELLLELVGATGRLCSACHPVLHARLSRGLDDARRSLEELEQALTEGRARAAELRELWAVLGVSRAAALGSLSRLEEEAATLGVTVSPWDLPLEEAHSWLSKCQEMEAGADAAESSLAALSARADELSQRAGPTAAAHARLEGGALAHRLGRVRRSLRSSRLALQHGSSVHRGLVDGLRALGAVVEEAEAVLGSERHDAHPPGEPGGAHGRAAEIKLQLLSLAAAVPALEAARADGRQLLLDGSDAQHLRALSARWHRAVSQAALTSSQQQGQWLQRRSFVKKCRCWKRLLLEMEQSLDVEEAPGLEDGRHAKENGQAARVDLATTGERSSPLDRHGERPDAGGATALGERYDNLLERRRTVECLLVKVLSQQALVQEVMREGRELLESGRAADRSALGPKLALLAVVWRGAVRRTRHAREELARRAASWRRYLEAGAAARDALHRLEAEVTELERGSAGLSHPRVALLLEDTEAVTRATQRTLGGRATALEAAAAAAALQLEPAARGRLHHEVVAAHERWKQAGLRLHILHQRLTCSLQEREGWECVLEGSLEKQALLQERLFLLLLPSQEPQLQEQQLQCRELEQLVGECTEELEGLEGPEGPCSSLELPASDEDRALTEARVAGVRWQWADLQDQVSRLSRCASERHEEWETFVRRDSRLCEWLVRLEQAVSRGGEGSLEEMLGWLEKECKDEVEAAGDCWARLQAFGNQLVAACGATRAAEISDRLGRTEDRWNHLHYFWATRVRWLQDVSGNKQHLDSAMGSLRSWLACMEATLAQPIIYHDFEATEIQLKLAQQQELQRDIEEHSASVSSVLGACGALLQDCDACAGKAESEGLSQATRGLERRWRNICATAMERRLRIEDTWRLWQKFREDHTRLEEWLVELERTAASPSSSLVLYTQAKEELKRFEGIQRQVHESLTQLELVNKQYRRLARENRTDATCCLRRMVLSCNQRWDDLQRRVAAILRRLKHFVSQRDEFETTRESLVVWLTQMDLQLTNLEHFSEFDREVKLRQLRAYQQEIELNTARIEELITHAEELIQKSEPLDAAVIEEELEQLRRDWQDVFARVERYLTRIHGLLVVVTDDDDDQSDAETEPEELDGVPPSVEGMSVGVANAPIVGSVGDPCLLRPSATRSAALAHPSGRDTPASLEWDYQFDITRMEGAPERGEDEDDDGGYDDADGTLTDIAVTETHEAFIAQTESVLRTSRDGNGNVLELQLQQLNMALEATRYHLQQTEHFLSRRTPTGPDLDGTYAQYMQLLTECQSSVERVRCMGEALMEGQEDGSHSTGLQQQLSGVFERWEELREQAQAKEQRMVTRLQQWRQLDAQAHELALWLDGAQATLGQCRASTAAHSPQLSALQLSLSQLRELQEDAESRRPLVLSLALGARELESSCGDGEEEEEDDDSWSSTDSEAESTAAAAAARVCVPGVRPTAGQTLLQLLPDVLCRWKRVNGSLEELERTLFDNISNIQASREMKRDRDSHPPVNIDHPVHSLPSGSNAAERGAAAAQSLAPARSAAKETPGSFARRVVFASLPFQLMLLFTLLLLVCLMPSTEEQPICAHVNNFARSFHPMLIYTNGPPPT